MNDARQERIPALDLVRFLAAVAVTWFHWFSMDTREPVAAAGYGYLGVHLFFMVSGFVILMTARGASFRAFVVARIVRLYPAFWLCCALTVLVVLVADPAYWPSFFSWPAFVGNMTMFPGAVGVEAFHASYWTLLFEAKFYILIGALILFGWLDRIEVVLWAWLAAALVTTSPAMVRLLMTDYAAYFVGGCACYLLRERATAARWALLACALAMAVAFMLADDANAGRRVLASAIVAGFFVLMLAIAMDWVRMPRSEVAVVLGAMSYPIYLLHQRIGQVFLGQGDRTPELIAATAFFVLAVSWCVHVWGEKPLAAWMRRRLAQADGGAWYEFKLRRPT